MNLSELISEINALADELEPASTVLGFVNDAIARINIECDATFPFMTLQQQDEELAFPEKWVRVLIIPFGVGRLKQRDSSQFEYTDAYNEFLTNINTFKTKYQIPEEYQDAENTGSYASDIYEKPPFGWWNF